jgi:hypothetical protein
MEKLLVNLAANMRWQSGEDIARTTESEDPRAQACVSVEQQADSWSTRRRCPHSSIETVPRKMAVAKVPA